MMATGRWTITRYILSAILVSASAFATAQELDHHPRTLITKGFDLSAEEAKDLEQQLEAAPGDLALRTQLLGYYWKSRDHQARSSHVLWLIENHPAAEIAGLPYAQLNPIRDDGSYTNAKEAWLKQVERHGDDAAVLGNAAAYLLLYDRDEAESLLIKAQAIEPDNAHWAGKLGQLYQLQTHGLSRSGSAAEKKEAAGKALQQFEKALEGAEPQGERSSLLINIAKSAFDAGDLQRAETAATEMLKVASDEPDDWNTGNAIHHGNLILGRIAVQSGDMAEAKERLLAAGKTPGSPQLNSFGPNMTLAQELLEQGEQETVLDYFALCSKFWDGQLTEWTAQVKEGDVPDFGGNLFY